MSFSYFKDNETGKRWMFCCMCTADTEDYYIKLDRFFATRNSSVWWLVHMHEKVWMDWNEFMDMLSRYHEEEMLLQSQAVSVR
jgi:hypothetical protein